MRNLLCYLGRHRWQKKVSDGAIYYECRRCGKTRDPHITPPMPNL
jgi:hypothetical protein